MADEIELIHDSEGLAVIGNPSAVERFLNSVGLLPFSRELPLDRLGSALDTGSKIAEAASNIAENAGRYVRLTKESAEQVKEFGLMPTKTKGISHAMLGDPGSISKWIQIEDGPASLLMNPAILSGAAGVMAQLARQQEAQELKQLLVAIDGKLDDVRRRQRDEVLAKMDRVSSPSKKRWRYANTEGIAKPLGTKSRPRWAQSPRSKQTHYVPWKHSPTRPTTSQAWAHSQGRPRILKQRSASGSLCLRDASSCRTSMRCWSWIMSSTRHPASLDGHRIGLDAALQQRRSKIVLKTGHLMTRLDQAGGVARENVVLHARAARKVINSINTVSDSIDDFHMPFAIESDREALTSTRWRDAVRDPQQLRNRSRGWAEGCCGCPGHRDPRRRGGPQERRLEGIIWRRRLND